MYAEDLSEPKYQFLIKKRADAGIKNLNDPSAFIEHSKTMDDVYNNINDYNPKSRYPDYIEKRKNLLNNAENVYDGREMIINAFKDKIFTLSPEEGLSESVGRDEDEDEDRFYTPKEVTPRSEIADFGIRQMFEDEDETPRDMPDLESEESAAQRRKQKGQRLK